MATTTPNFGWSVPTSSDLVKNGAVAIETLGDSIDASLVDLKGGTTGQVLAKATGTDMDFTWSTPTAVTGWTSYTPTWTNLTVGNGTLVGAYRDNGSMIDLSVKLTFGSTTSVSGNISFSLPVNAETTSVDTFRAGGRYLDNGVREIISYFQVKTSTVECRYAYINFNGSGVNYEIMSNVNATEPWTWATNDQIMAFFSYRKA